MFVNNKKQNTHKPIFGLIITKYWTLLSDNTVYVVWIKCSKHEGWVCHFNSKNVKIGLFQGVTEDRCIPLWIMIINIIQESF